jgi:hypothetical protein
MRRGQALDVPRLLVRNLAQGAAEAVDVAREPHRRGIGQELALAAHRRLQQAPGQPAERADADQRQTGQGAGAATSALVGAPQALAQAPDHLQAPDQAHKAHVQPRVAMHDVAELVRDHALQLGARQAFERAAGHHHHRIVGAPAGGQGVDRIVARQHPGLRRRPLAAGDGHLLHDVGEALLAPRQLVVAAGLHRTRAGELGHVRAPLVAHAARFDPAAAQHEQQHQRGVGLEEPVGQAARKRDRRPVGQRQHRVDGDDEAHHHQHEHQHQVPGLLLGGFLVLAKAHRREPGEER